tara:strand:+ start:197 stop:877 length:681 start_codon:yes stop_codon:yes gene_type:complete
MPHKDPLVAAACKRAYYLAHKDQWRISNGKIKIKQKQEAEAKKAAEALVPKQIVQKFCIDCAVDITEAYKSKHGLHCAACKAIYNKTYREANAQRIAEQKLKWKIENRAHVEKQSRLYSLANPDKKTAARKKWSAANPGKDNASKQLNAQARQKRVPTWLSDDELWMIEQAYELAALRTKMFGFAWHVDHVIPLCGKKVSGLHTPYNLQVIPAVENLRKSNRMEIA